MSKKKQNVAYAAPAAPSFIQRLREKHNVKAPEESRREQLMAKFSGKDGGRPDDEEALGVMRDDEAPQIVVLKKTHLSKEEAEKLVAAGAAGGEQFMNPDSEAAAAAEGGEGKGDTPADTGSAPSTGGAAAPGVAAAPSKAKVVKTSFGTAKKGSNVKRLTKDGKPKKRSKKLNKPNSSLLSFG